MYLPDAPPREFDRDRSPKMKTQPHGFPMGSAMASSHWAGPMEYPFRRTGVHAHLAGHGPMVTPEEYNSGRPMDIY